MEACYHCHNCSPNSSAGPRSTRWAALISHPRFSASHGLLRSSNRSCGVSDASVRRQNVRPGRDNLIANYTPPGPAPYSVLFEAHQDTVPVDEMIIDPFGAKIEGGKLYGRGSCDVKAGVAVMLAAFGRLVKERPIGSARVILAFTVDEENGGLGVLELMRSGLRTDYAIVAEPTLLNIVNAHKGVARWALGTTGRACHSSRPEQGVNAVYRMARLLRGVEDYAERLRNLPPDPVLGPRTISVGLVSGGVSPNTVPDSCSAILDRRLLPGETYESATADFDAFLRSLPGLDYLVHTLKQCAGVPSAQSGEVRGVGAAAWRGHQQRGRQAQRPFGAVRDGCVPRRQRGSSGGGIWSGRHRSGSHEGRVDRPSAARTGR